MSESAGAGSPIWFRCAACRSTLRWTDPVSNTHRGMRVKLTGKTKKYYGRTGSALGVRSTHVCRQYECLDCGHVGYSNHIDLERLERRGGR